MTDRLKLADLIDQCAAIQLVGSAGIKGYLPVGSPKIISSALRASAPPDAGCREALRKALEQIAGDDEPRVALSGTTAEGLRNIARAALAIPQPDECTCGCSDMLWKWFGSEERCGAEYMRHEMREGLSADDFKAMLDEHEAALISPSPSLHPPTVDAMRLADQLENHAENLTKTALNNRDTRFIKLLEKSANTLRALVTNAKKDLE